MRQSNLWKRLVALTAACTLIAGVFTGCGNDKPVNTSESNKTASESSEVVSSSTQSKVEEVVEEPAELTYWGSIDSNATSVITNYSELGFIQEMMEAANVNITFSHPAAGTAAEQFNLKIAGNKYEEHGIAKLSFEKSAKVSFKKAQKSFLKSHKSLQRA